MLLINDNQLVSDCLYEEEYLFPGIVNVKDQLFSPNMRLNIIY